ncbi:DUF4017 family protein [Kurthia sp. Dielmo]|uniref:DUF4017 family protein n=1 Tax=Kurthia sp. Dielmo TaxID=1033738 RepID=UPI001124332D
MKGWLASILMYALICVIGLALLIIQGYSIWSWKFFVLQLYAIPMSLLVLGFNYWQYKKAPNKQAL